MTDEIEEDILNIIEQLTKAISSKNIEEWRLYISMRNVLYKSIEAAKTIFYVNLFKRSKQMWNTVKKLNKSEKGSTPTSIVINNKLSSSPVKICTAMNAFFHNKILTIRQGFTKCLMDPIEILSKLIPRPNKKFTLPYITVKEAKDIIFKLKRSNTAGYDSIS